MQGNVKQLAHNFQASSIVSMSLTVAMVANGYGKTVEVIEPSHMTRSLKYSNFAVLINGFSMAFLKVSIGLSILRLQLGKSMYWIVVGSIVLSVVCNALVVVSTLFGCRPLEAVWNRQLLLAGEASCLPRIVNMSNSYVQTGKLSRLLHGLQQYLLLRRGQHRHGPVLLPWSALLSLKGQGVSLQQMGASRRFPDWTSCHNLRNRQMF